jgi:hypothetical protein
MSTLKPALTLAFVLGICGNAWAGCDPPHRDPRDCSPGKPAPARPPQATPDTDFPFPLAKKLAPRRSVPQVVGRMPQSSAAPAPVYGYRPSGAPAPPALPAPALPVNTCDPGACRDAYGALHRSVGAATVDENGRVCIRNGAWLQCQ